MSQRRTTRTRALVTMVMCKEEEEESESENEKEWRSKVPMEMAAATAAPVSMPTSFEYVSARHWVGECQCSVLGALMVIGLDG